MLNHFDKIGIIANLWFGLKCIYSLIPLHFIFFSNHDLNWKCSKFEQSFIWKMFDMKKMEK